MPRPKLPALDWPLALADLIKKAGDGDTIVVRSDAMLELARAAAAPDRLNRPDLKFDVATPEELRAAAPASL